ncbi:5-(carboxyamino)imidazole ribonucleotide synthase [Natronospora cellulosivora (SeqCode)]
MKGKGDKTKQKIGIIGGGQLGKMMILEAKKMDFYVIILDPAPDCPAHSIADEHLIADFDDQKAIRELANKSDLITYEFEHIAVDVLKELEDNGFKIYPTANSLEIIQNKYSQKALLAANNIPIPDFFKVKDIEDILKGTEKYGYPIMLKSCTGGYDGKGNALIREESEIKDAYEKLGNGKHPLMIEEFVPFLKEISVLACRGLDGKVAVYPVAENEHRDNILYETRVPASINEKQRDMAMELASQVMEVFNGIGMFCVEMFLTEEGELLINEVAPRPHNSGHYSIEGCVTSQFEQHIRAIAGLPLGETTLLRPTVMRNILGTGKEGRAMIKGLEESLKNPGVNVHIYGKTTSKPGRKMGHITVISSLLEYAVNTASKASELLEIKGE